MSESVDQLTSVGVERPATPRRRLGPQMPVRSGAGIATRAMLGAHRQHALIVVACLLPFLSFVLASRGAWLLDYQWEDNWSYLKYFHDWTTADPILRDFMDHDYKGARVAWIALGYLVYHALDPLAANLTLNFLVAAVTILLTLGLATRLFGWAAGGTATILASAFQVFYSSGVPHAWSYQGSICNVFYLVLLWSLTEHARGSRRRRWAVLAGAAATLTLLTGTTYIITLPWALAYWVLLRGKPTVADVLEGCTMAVIGAAIAVSALATASIVAGGPLLFMLPLLYKSAGIASDRSFGRSFQAWLPVASWLAFPAIVLLGGAVTALVMSRRRTLRCPEAGPFVAAFVGFAGLWLMMIGLDATIQAYVQYEHYNFMIVGPAALALAGVLRWLPRGADRHAPAWPGLVYPLLAVMVVVPQMLLDPALVAAVAEPITQSLRALSLPGTAVASVLVASVGLGCIALGAWRPLLVAGACFGVACALTNPSPAPFHLSASCGVERDDYLLVTDVTRWMASRGWHVNARAWYPPDDAVARPDGCPDFPLAWTFAEIEQAGMVWKVSTPLPTRIVDLSQREVRNIGEKPRSELVILSAPQLAKRYDAELAAWAKSSGVNPVPRLAESRTFTRGGISLTVQVYRLRQG